MHVLVSPSRNWILFWYSLQQLCLSFSDERWKFLGIEEFTAMINTWSQTWSKLHFRRGIQIGDILGHRMLVVITVFLLGSHFSMKGKQSKICRGIGVKNLMTPCPMQRLLELLVLRNLTGRIPSPSWSQMLTPKVKPSFRLNFVEDILSYWSHAC